jgi:hypothetical protein
MIDCRLNSFRNGKRLDRAMGHIFQWPSPVVGCAAQQHRLRALAACALWQTGGGARLPVELGGMEALGGENQDLVGGNTVSTSREEEEMALGSEDRTTVKETPWWRSAALAQLCSSWGKAMRRR